MKMRNIHILFFEALPTCVSSEEEKYSIELENSNNLSSRHTPELYLPRQADR